MDKDNNELMNEPTNQKKISVIKLEFMQAAASDIPALLDKYQTDDRSGVITICKMYRSRLEAQEKELKRIKNMQQYELKYKDYQYICGTDEVGRGPFAGPVMACAVIQPKDCNILYINDSKQ
jgi:ribonuclease HII